VYEKATLTSTANFGQTKKKNKEHLNILSAKQEHQGTPQDIVCETRTPRNTIRTFLDNQKTTRSTVRYFTGTGWLTYTG